MTPEMANTYLSYDCHRGNHSHCTVPFTGACSCRCHQPDTADDSPISIARYQDSLRMHLAVPEQGLENEPRDVMLRLKALQLRLPYEWKLTFEYPGYVHRELPCTCYIAMGFDDGMFVIQLTNEEGRCEDAISVLGLMDDQLVSDIENAMEVLLGRHDSDCGQ